jgi:integrin beta 3
VIGPRGEKGDAGPRGEKGDTGAVGKDGAAGRDGVLTMEDIEVISEDGGRTDVWRQRSTGRVIGRIVTRRVIYRGAFKEGEPYAPGDMVSFGGSLWHCDDTAPAIRPGEVGKGWSLAAKRGRDGKDGKAPLDPSGAKEPIALK